MSSRPLPVLIKQLNTVEIENLLAREAPLFIPIGTVEPHGRHLPVGTDTLCAEKIAEELSINLNGAVAPSLEYGVTNSLAQTAPSSFFSEELYEKFVEGILQSFVRHGFKCLILVNGHGGNVEPLKRLARRLIRQEAMAVSVIHWWKLSEKFVEPIFKTGPGGHAAVEETAAMLHFCPTMVYPDNYSPDTDDYVADDGIWLYPPPGEVILDKEGTGRPIFDCGKSADFIARTVDDITAMLNHWLNSMKRLTGGLRP
ncbi:MAG: creatininase family protein [Candidatus Riflebacteria bacterium]